MCCQNSYVRKRTSKHAGEKPLPKAVSAVLVDPSVDEAVETAREAVSQRQTLMIVGRCQVHYSGRAKSKLEPGERTLLIKQDGSILIHRPSGYEPVNWQPSGCIFHVSSTNSMLEIKAVRQNPSETVRVSFYRIALLAAISLIDEGEFSLYASESDMQKAILLKPSIIEEGFKPISYEKKVEPGFVDVYGVDKDGKLVVVEIKRKAAGKEAVLQLARYLDAIRQKTDREVRGILAAPDIGKDVQRLLASLRLEYKAVDPKKCANVLVKTETRKLETFFPDMASTGNKV